MKKIIGLTTGFAYKTINPISIDALNICKRVSSDTVELNCIGGTDKGELHLLKNIKPEDLADFEHISLHAPSSRIIYRNDSKTKIILDLIEETYHRLDIKYVVFHPDTISDYSIFDNYVFPAAIENLDKRKFFGKNVKDLKKVFQVFDCRFVLDINHCFSIDPTMRLAEDLISEFKNRLCGVHISGHKKYHDLLYETRQIEIMKAVAGLNVPMVIESRCAGEEEAKKEYEYINNYFIKEA